MTCPCGNPDCDGPLDHARTARLIEEFGWTALGVMDEVPFTYTIGLTGKGLPELLVFGLSMETAHAVFTEVIPRLIEGEIRHGTVRDDLVQNGFRTGFVSLPSKEACADYLIQAESYYGRPVEVLQVVWPDKGNRLPWEPGYAKVHHGVQDRIVPLDAPILH